MLERIRVLALILLVPITIILIEFITLVLRSISLPTIIFSVLIIATLSNKKGMRILNKLFRVSQNYVKASLESLKETYLWFYSYN